jgi:superfamily II DNA or RNA helicase
MTGKKISHTRKPEGMAVSDWQIALRRQYGREAAFLLQNIGAHPLFSDFEVTNPASGNTYRVAVRGSRPGTSFCSCPDYAVNTLGTCKHIEFVVRRLERDRGDKAALARGFDPPYSEVFVRYGVKQEVVFKPGSTCPPALKTLAARYFDQRGIIKPTAIPRFQHFVRAARRSSHDIRIYEDAVAFIARLRDRAGLIERVEALFPDGASGPAFNDLLKIPLYPYQCQGALFAAKAGRCLIADDMGLGKTIQAIAAAEILARAVGIERVLVVAPTSLKHQWKQEVEGSTSRAATIIEGSTAERTAAYASPSFFKVTNYDVVHLDLAAIKGWAPDLVILDEAQRIKNWKTRTAQTIKRLPSDYAIVLSGTPLENRLEELHSIVEFVDRFHLGPRFRFLAEHQQVNEDGRVIGYRNLSKVGDTLRPILIRRTKQSVLTQLPPRLEKRLFFPMTQEQRTQHEENRDIVARIVAKWRRLGFLQEGDQRRLMIALQNMRMACNSTYLLDPKTDSGVKADECLSLAQDLLEQPGTKVVVFSQWVRTHELLAKRLKAKGLDFVLFHGGVPGRARTELIRKFREDEACRVFLSTDAGSVGLNLQHATTVINMDQPWNPAVLEQRIGRIHRLGQHRPVQIYHLIAEHTIEHGMLNLLSFKRSLFAGVLDGGQDEVFLGGTRLTRFMESVERAAGAISQPEVGQAQETIENKTVRSEYTHAAPGSGHELWAGLISSCRTLLAGLEQTLAKPTNVADPSSSPTGVRALWVERDERTGTPYLKLPLPGPEVLRTIADTLSALTRGMNETT